MRARRRSASDRKRFLPRRMASWIPILFGMALLCQAAFAAAYVVTGGARFFPLTAFAADPEAASREPSVTVRYHGQEQQAASTGETVGELLTRLGLEPEAGDLLSQSQDTLTWDGMVLSVDRVLTDTQSYAVIIPYETVRCNSAALPLGTEQVLAAGADGEMLRTADVTYVNGKESGRVILSETVTVMPVTQIIAVGTGPVPEAAEGPVIGDGYITLPTGEILTYHGTAQVQATAYTHTDFGCSMLTYTGTTVHVGTVAVDPRFIPYGTRMFIIAEDGSYVYGVAQAEDCGGDIKGNRVDLYLPTYDECIQFGRRTCTVYFLG